MKTTKKKVSKKAGLLAASTAYMRVVQVISENKGLCLDDEGDRISLISKLSAALLGSKLAHCENCNLEFLPHIVNNAMCKFCTTPVRNRIQCPKCFDVIESMHRHDFKWCKCHSVAVDCWLDIGNDDSRILTKE